MKKVGIIGGLGPASTLLYYKDIIEGYREQDIESRISRAGKDRKLSANCDRKREYDGLDCGSFRTTI